MPVLSHQSLLKIIGGESPLITGERPLVTEGKDSQVQMASIDLSLGSHLYGQRSSGLPSKGQSVRKGVIDSLVKYEFDLSETEDKLLIRNQTYVIPLNESIHLPKGFSAKISPKSSIGRIDVFTCVLMDGVAKFDNIPEGYEGPLYLEVTPLSWDIYLRPAQRLVQMRIKRDACKMTGTEVSIEHSRHGIVWDKEGNVIPTHALDLADDGLYMHVDLSREVVGFVARDPVLESLSLARENAYDPARFWEPIMREPDGSVILSPGKFYLMATKERIKIPPGLCGDIWPSDATAGEFRTHYAGFFDPGFGGIRPEDLGTVGVMEIRGREKTFRLQDGQPICRMEFERMDAVPDLLYGDGSSHYTGSRASLAKFFQNRVDIWKE